jgi:isopentenyl-diphosphate delta-isomerase
MSKEIVCLVDKDDNVVGVKPRDRLTGKDRWRLSSLIIYDNNGRLLLAQRSSNKTLSPLKWEFSATGTVLADESYEDAIIRESEEELGFTPSVIKILDRFEYASEKGRRWISIYCTQYDDQKSFDLQKSEVEQCRWVSTEELLNWVHEHPNDFVTSVRLATPAISRLMA